MFAQTDNGSHRTLYCLLHRVPSLSFRLDYQTHQLSIINTSQLSSGQLLTGTLNSENARYRSVPLFHPLFANT